MIEYIKGELTELTPAMAVVEAAGVGYALNISLNTYSAIQGSKAVRLYVHEAIVTGGRDDSFTLYGFLTKQERALYRMLLTVSGCGSKHGAYDSVVPYTERAMQCHCWWRREDAQKRERYWPQDCPTHHRGPQRQDCC